MTKAEELLDRTIELVPTTARPVARSLRQNAAAQADVEAAQSRGATGIRINQQQVNADGERVVMNRPDLQYTESGQRVYAEYGSSHSSQLAHQERILATDPDAEIILKDVD